MSHSHLVQLIKAWASFVGVILGKYGKLNREAAVLQSKCRMVFLCLKIVLSPFCPACLMKLRDLRGKLFSGSFREVFSSMR